MSKQTPGEWVITTGGEGERLVTSVGARPDHHCFEDDVCLVYGGNIGDATVAWADARLICAAPELLAVVEQLVEIDTGQLKYGPMLHDEARAAIAKAKEGE